MMYRKSFLKNRMNQLEYQLIQKQQAKSELSTYAASVADGSISYEDLSNCPSQLFGRMTQFMFNSHNAAMMGAQGSMAQMQAAGMIGGATGTDAAAVQQQQMYNQLVFQNLYKQQREQAAKVEAKILNEQEKQMDQEVLKLQNELTLVQNEYNTISKAVDSAAQMDTVSYVA